MNNVFLAHDKLTLFVPGYAIPPSLDFMQYAALEEKNCDVICIRPIAKYPEKNVFLGFNGIRTRGFCVRAAVLYQLSSMKTHTLEAGQIIIIEFINPWKEYVNILCYIW